MKQVRFTQTALDDLKSFKSINPKLIFKVLELIEDIQKRPFEGIGKPELLKHDYAGYWSRRINEEHRLIYRISEDSIEIYRCAGHYTKS